MNPLARFFKARPVVLLTLFLALQAAAFYKFSAGEQEPLVALLNTLPEQLGAWRAVSQATLDPYSSSVLHPDDYVIRTYVHAAGGRAADLFVAYFRTQRTGHVPHSPRNCLPGRGWAINRRGGISIPASVGEAVFPANRFVVAKGDARNVVLYWYQSAGRAVANEYAAKFFLVLDSIRYRRSDTALVRVTVPCPDRDEQRAERTAVELASHAYSALVHHLKSEPSLLSVLVPPGTVHDSSLVTRTQE